GMAGWGAKSLPTSSALRGTGCWGDALKSRVPPARAPAVNNITTARRILFIDMVRKTPAVRATTPAGIAPAAAAGPAANQLAAFIVDTNSAAGPSADATPPPNSRAPPPPNSVTP